MNDYLKILRNVEQSTEQLLKNEYHSIESSEIKRSAVNLQEAIQPCIQELNRFAIKFIELTDPCFEKLFEAEDVWDSKLRITEADKNRIWQQIGEISGCYFRIKKLAIHHKLKMMNDFKHSWEGQIEESKKDSFLDEKGQTKVGIGWADKEQFNKKIPSRLTSHCQSLDESIEKVVKLLIQEIDNKYLLELKSYIDLFDKAKKASLEIQVNETLHNIQIRFTELTPNLSNTYLLDLEKIFTQKLQDWRSRWGDISWDEVTKFKDEVTEKTNQRINLLIDDRVELIKQALEQAIAFYSEFLEEQERYQQETTEQRLAEKAWIDHQRQELEKLQASISTLEKLSVV